MLLVAKHIMKIRGSIAAYSEGCADLPFSFQEKYNFGKCMGFNISLSNLCFNNNLS